MPSLADRVQSGHGHAHGRGHGFDGARLTHSTSSTYTPLGWEGRAGRRAVMRRREVQAIGAALLLLLAAASSASASPRSQLLYAKALIPFNAHRWEEAHRLLDEAAA